LLIRTNNFRYSILHILYIFCMRLWGRMAFQPYEATDFRRVRSRASRYYLMMDSGWSFEIDRISRAEWAQLLEQFQDANFYQTSSYGEVRWGAENLSRLVLRHEGELLGIAQLRIFQPTRLDFGLAYLGWGPLCERRGYGLSREVAERMAQGLEEEYCGRRGLFLCVAPNAFVGSPRAALLESGFSQFTRDPLFQINPHRTLVMDLSPSLEDLRKGFNRKWRNQLTRSEKNNLTIAGGSGVDEFRKFCTLYREMRERKAFKTSVDIADYLKIQEDLDPSQRMRVFLCQENGVPVAGLVASVMGETAIYILGATTEAGLHLKASYFLQWTLIHWLKENGIRWYDLGGVDPDVNPGGYHFKKGISGVEAYPMDPLVSCRSAAVSAIVRLGLATYRALRSSETRRAPSTLARYGQ
jgi:hypothetical protein